jgi:hypothetical protein
MSPGSFIHVFFTLYIPGAISVRTHCAVRRLTATLRQPSRLTGMTRESPRRDGLVDSRLAVAKLFGESHSNAQAYLSQRGPVCTVANTPHRR